MLLVVRALKGFISLRVQACLQGCERSNIVAIFHWLLWIAPHTVQQLFSLGQLFLPLEHRINIQISVHSVAGNESKGGDEAIIRLLGLSTLWARWGTDYAATAPCMPQATLGDLAPLEPSWPGWDPGFARNSLRPEPSL